MAFCTKVIRDRPRNQRPTPSRCRSRTHPPPFGTPPGTPPPLNPRTTQGPDRATDLGLLFLTLVWGLNFAVVKGALEAIPPMAFNALRFPLASLTVWAILRARGPLRMPERRDVGTLLALGIAGNGAYQLLFIQGLDRTTAGNTALMLATVPVWAALLSALTREGTLDRWILAGIASTLGGMVLVVAGGPSGITLGGATLPGDLLAAGAAMLWATYTVGSRRLILRYGSVPVTAWTLWSGTVVLVLLGIPALGTVAWREVPPVTGWGAVVFAGVLALGLSYLLWYRGVHRLGSARTAAYSNLVPVVALGGAWALLGEVPSGLQWTGAGIIFGGILLTRRGTHLPPRTGPAPSPVAPSPLERGLVERPSGEPSPGAPGLDDDGPDRIREGGPGAPPAPSPAGVPGTRRPGSPPSSHRR